MSLSNLVSMRVVQTMVEKQYTMHGGRQIELQLGGAREGCALRVCLQTRGVSLTMHRRRSLMGTTPFLSKIFHGQTAGMGPLR